MESLCSGGRTSVGISNHNDCPKTQNSERSFGELSTDPKHSNRETSYLWAFQVVEARALEWSPPNRAWLEIHTKSQVDKGV
eukprot:5683210-Pyramimonas_sp.AAC.2